MEANAGKAFQMQIIFNIFPHISLHCKLVPVQYWEYEYGLLDDLFPQKSKMLGILVHSVQKFFFWKEETKSWRQKVMFREKRKDSLSAVQAPCKTT